MNEKLEKLNRQLAQGEARLRRAQHEEKILAHQIKPVSYTHLRAHETALHQRGYAGKFPDKAGSADGR